MMADIENDLALTTTLIILRKTIHYYFNQDCLWMEDHPWARGDLRTNRPSAAQLPTCTPCP